MKTVYRPSHADYTYQTKYGIRDPRGGGRSSARETIARCVAGAIAKLALKQYGIQIQAYTSQVGPIQLAGSYQDYDLSLTEESDVRCPDPKTASEMETLIAEVKSKGDTIGGVITCVAKGVPVGLGEPVFGKLHVVEMMPEILGVMDKETSSMLRMEYAKRGVTFYLNTKVIEVKPDGVVIEKDGKASTIKTEKMPLNSNFADKFSWWGMNFEGKYDLTP